MRKSLLAATAAAALVAAGLALVAIGQDPAAAAPAAAPVPSSLDGFMTVMGSRQGAIQGSGKNGRIEVISLSHEIVSPRDAASGLPTGKRQHKPLTITKEIDKSTPLLLNALVTNENLSSVKVAITDGTSNTIALVELTNASIADRSQGGRREEIAFVYQKITWTWVDGGVTAEDTWSTPDS